MLGKLCFVTNAILKLLYDRHNVFLLHHIEVNVYEHLHQQHTVASIDDSSVTRDHIAKILKYKKRIDGYLTKGRKYEKKYFCNSRENGLTPTFLLHALLNPEAKNPPKGPRVAANMQINNP